MLGLANPEHSSRPVKAVPGFASPFSCRAFTPVETTVTVGVMNGSEIMPTVSPAAKTSGKPTDKQPEKIHKFNGFVPMDHDAFLAKLTPKDRLNVERHVAAIEEQSTRAHAKLWKRIAGVMMTLAPHSAKANGQQSMQFYIQDGKYRMQIFALEDLRDGTIHVYAADALDEAIKAGVLGKAAKTGDETPTYKIGSTKETLSAERLDGKVSNPAPFYKDMLGWNRRAVHVALPVMASDVQADAVEKLLLFGAKKAGVKFEGPMK
jgi:hypothetical protein